MRTPKPWTVLVTSDDEPSIVVPDDFDDVLVALLRLIEAHTGQQLSADNPVITRAATDLRIETWHYCTKALRADEGVDDQGCEDWWAPYGDSKRCIQVLSYPGSVFVLAEAAAAGKPGDDLDGLAAFAAALPLDGLA
jgi:hypothetical protein